MLGAATTPFKALPMAKLAARGAVEGAATQAGFNVADKVTFNPNQDLSEGVGTSALVGGIAPTALRSAGAGIDAWRGNLPPTIPTISPRAETERINRMGYDERVAALPELNKRLREAGKPEMTIEQFGGAEGNRMSAADIQAIIELGARFGEVAPLASENQKLVAKMAAQGLIDPTNIAEARRVLNEGPSAFADIQARNAGLLAANRANEVTAAQQAAEASARGDVSASVRGVAEREAADARAAQAAQVQSLENQAKIDAGIMARKRAEAAEAAKLVNATEATRMKDVRGQAEAGFDAMLAGETQAQAAEKANMQAAAAPQAVQQIVEGAEQTAKTLTPAPESAATAVLAKAPEPPPGPKNKTTEDNAITAKTAPQGKPGAADLPKVGPDAAIKPNAPSQAPEGSPAEAGKSAPAPTSVAMPGKSPTSSMLSLPTSTSNPTAAEVVAAGGSKAATPMTPDTWIRDATNDYVRALLARERGESADVTSLERVLTEFGVDPAAVRAEKLLGEKRPPSNQPPARQEPVAVTSALPADLVNKVQSRLFELSGSQDAPARRQLLGLVDDVRAGKAPTSALDAALVNVPKDKVAAPVATVENKPASSSYAPLTGSLGKDIDAETKKAAFESAKAMKPVLVQPKLTDAEKAELQAELRGETAKPEAKLGSPERMRAFDEKEKARLPDDILNQSREIEGLRSTIKDLEPYAKGLKAGDYDVAQYKERLKTRRAELKAATDELKATQQRAKDYGLPHTVAAIEKASASPAPLKIKKQTTQSDPLAADRQTLDAAGLTVRPGKRGNWELYNKDIDEVTRDLGGMADEVEAVKEATRIMREESRQGIGSKMRSTRRDEAGMINMSLVADKISEVFDNTTKKIDASYMLGRLRNLVVQGKLPTAEMQIYEQNGLKDFLAVPRTPVELREWMRENGPKIKVESYGMDQEFSPEKARLDELQHEFETARSGGPVGASYYRIRTAETANEDVYDVPGMKGALENVAYHEKMGNMSKAQADNLREYADLLQRGADKPLDKPQATGAYRMVSAFPTDQPMPDWTTTKGRKNVQRVDVVIPETIYKHGGATHWEQDNLHENLPNTLGWAMIQYTTGPRGEKIAHIAESQSRWGQQAREWQKKAKDENLPINSENYRDDFVAQANHPLLSDYNRLILKAAIDQARKEGATHIHIADAETAMMTEGHDKAARHDTKIFSYADKAKAEQYAQETGGKIENQGNNWYVFGPRNVIDQAGGMRFNYDNQLPKIAAEMLGQGERMSLGKHKNAMYKSEYGSDIPTVYKPRPDLIFRNPDGTPKTDVSGMLFKLPDYEPQFSVAGKDKGAARPLVKLAPTGGMRVGDSRRSEEGSIINPAELIEAGGRAVAAGARSMMNRVRSATNQLGDHADRTNDETARYGHRKLNETATVASIDATKIINENQSFWNKLNSSERSDLQDILQYERAWRKRWPGDMSPRVEQAYLETRNLMRELGERAAREGPRIQEGEEWRPLIVDEFWTPEALSMKVVKELQDTSIDEATGRPVRDIKLDEFRDWARQNGLSDAQIDTEIKRFDIENKTADADLEFDALHRPMTIPLPPGWAGNTQDAINRYATKYAFEMARHKYIDQDKLLGPMSRGQRESLDDLGRLTQRLDEAGKVGDTTDALFRAALNSFALQINPGRQTIAQRLSGVANPLAVQTGATIRDTINMFGTLVDDAGVKNSIKGVLEGVNKYRDLKARGLIKDTGNLSGDVQRVGEAFENGQVLELFRDAIRAGNRLAGVDALNKFMQAVSSAAGIARAKEAMAKNDEAFFKRVGIPEWRAKTPQEVEDFVARWVVEGSQGSMGAKDQPTHLLKASGAGAQFFPIMRWAFSFSNQQIDRAWKPLMDSSLSAGQRVKPLATRLAGAAGATALANTLLQTMFGREDRNPSFKEWEAAGYPNKLKYLTQKLSDLQVLPAITAFANVVVGNQQMPRNLGVEVAPNTLQQFAALQEIKRDYSYDDYVKAVDAMLDKVSSNWRDISKLVGGETKDPIEQARSRYEAMNTTLRPAVTANPFNLTTQFNKAKTVDEVREIAQKIVSTANLDTPDVSVKGPSEDAAFDKWLEKSNPELWKTYRKENLVAGMGLDEVYNAKKLVAEAVNKALEQKRLLLASKEPNDVKRAKVLKLNWEEGGTYELK
jgi:hypothetical protein